MKNKQRWWFRLAALAALAAILFAFTGGIWPEAAPTQVIAHRGANIYAPENTLPAYEKAIALGADGVETDVLMTADGVVVLSHDSSIDRCSDGTGRVRDMTLAQLREYDFGSWFSPAFAGTQIPTLDEFLDTVESVGLILIEFKSNEDDIAAKTVAAVQAHGMMHQVIFHSFDLTVIQACKAADPDAAIAFLYNPGSEYDQAIRKDAVGFCQQYHLDALHPQYAAHSSWLARRCAKIGVETRVWTANDRLFLAGCSGQGARGLITDQVELAQTIIRWPLFVRFLFGAVCDIASLISPYIS